MLDVDERDPTCAYVVPSRVAVPVRSFPPHDAARLRLAPGVQRAGSPLQFCHGRNRPLVTSTPEANVNPRSPASTIGPNVGFISRDPAVIWMGSAAACRGRTT